MRSHVTSRVSGAEKEPKYLSICRELGDEIKKLGIPPHSKFFSENEIARRFSVSPMTARHALNEMLERKIVVRRNASGTYVAHPFIPDRKLSSILVSGGTDVLNRLFNPFYCEIIAGIQEKASENAYKLLFHDAGFGSTELPEQIRRKECDAVIVVGNVPENYLTKLAETGLRVVVLDNFCNEIPSVNIDNYEGAKQAVSHLISRGAKRILHMAHGDQHVRTAEMRLKGYADTIVAAGLPFDKSMIFYGRYWFEYAEKKFSALIARKGVYFDAIFAGNDSMALAAIRVLRKKGVRIPEDVKIIGFDDIYASRMASPALSSIGFDKNLLGARAFELSIRQKETGSMHTVTQVKLLERESS